MTPVIGRSTSIFAVVCLIFLSAVTDGKSASGQEAEFRNLTKPVDPFDRLSSLPSSLRAKRAIELCLLKVKAISDDQSSHLGEYDFRNFPKESEGELLASARIILKTIAIANELQMSFHPELSTQDADKLKALLSIVGPFQGKASANSEASLSVEDSLIIVKSVAKIN